MTLPQLGALLLLALTLFVMPGAASTATGPRGEGSASISGVVVSNAHYRLDAVDPARLAGVQLTLSAASAIIPGKIMIRLSPSSPWYSCQAVEGTTWSCDTPGATIRAATELRVVSAS